MAGVRRWQQDCEIHGSTSHANRSSSVKAEVRGSSPASHLIPSEDSRQKRRSLPNQASTGSYTGSDASLDELFNMNNSRRSSAQVMPQRGDHMQMAMNQSRSSSWQPQMMNLNHSGQNDITQQQMFAHVGYLNASGTWPQHQQQAHQNMQMDIDQQGQQPHHHSSPHVHVPTITSQTHSHLFW